LGAREPKWPALRRNLAASTGEGAAYGAMVGMGETYLPAFALALGMGEVTAGLVASVPLLIGGLLQMATPAAIRWMGSFKRWIACSAAIQALSLMPLVLAAVAGKLSPAALLLIASVYWAGGLAAGPAWSTWIGYLVPSPVRSRFFAKRTRISQLLTLGGFLAGGLLLQWSQHESVLLAFAVIFGLACLCRLISAGLLLLHHESAETKRMISELARAQSRSSGRMAPHGMRLIAYLVVVQGMVQISGPYFTPYMLKQLHFSYGQYVVLVAVAFVAKAVSLALWGNVASRHGARALLWLGGVAIVPLAWLWTFSPSFHWILCVQVASGCMWAAYELGFFLMFFESMPVPQRARMLTYYNLANTSAWCIGSLAGGAVLAWLGPSVTSYWTIFTLSSVGRLAALGLLWRVEAVPLPRRPLRIAWRVWGLRPAAAALATPVLATLESPAEASAVDRGAVDRGAVALVGSEKSAEACLAATGDAVLTPSSSIDACVENQAA
jgi:MFS family permease